MWIAKFQNLCTYYLNKKKKLSSFRSGTGARDFTPLNVSAENLFENVVELPPIPCSESLSEQSQGTRVSTSTHRVPTVTPGAKKRKVDSSHDFYESMQKCLGAVGKKTVNETFAAFIASELDNLPCPKQQAAIRCKLCYTLFDCLE
ncbi:hypothetical protein TNIN_394681 [Trichonephila inaurata madagascariensis]|uniref:Uncharacterized protein n=1 Tax=Trichonephila inaurata madagascariensis TaxID=2747483 RepID=A0A8X6YU74_9ARAC|nr:hypothetical protein TNIN_394681 [Trichonephila inaurata madagascariensis]